MSTDPKSWVAGHVAALPKSGIRDFFELVTKLKGQGVISLGVGEPDFVTPEHIRNASIAAMNRGRTSYTSNLGDLELRQEIAKYVETHFGVSYRPEDQIIVTVGVSEALDLACRAFINPGDKVMYHQPCYVSYHPSIALAHGIPIAVPTFAKDDFAVTAESLRAAWEPGAKMLMLNLPCNPTGGTCSREQLGKIAEFCREKDLLVLTDEIYSELTFDGTHTSIASLPGMAERTIFLHGFSKAFAMTGWRIGYACGPFPLIDAMMKVHQYTMLCASIIAQDAALEALKNGWEGMQQMRAQYHRRRDLVVRRFNEIGLTCHSPRGSFYAFPNVEVTGLSEKDFAVGLLQQHKVAVVPGTAFGVNGTGHVRACFATSYEQLEEACNRMERFVQNSGQKPRA
ncbi:MAG: aminotransferase class I/II-fold pyridoxal phosphate-dependent enzyme [Opitutaceae bacterium]